MTGSETPLVPSRFEALIVPHRSLGRSGLRWIAGALVLLSAAISVGLWLVGAWPALGFTGLAAVLAVGLLRSSATPRGSEMLMLTDSGLQIVRTDRSGRRSERQLSGGWLRAVLEERPGRTPALWVIDRGARVEVAAELGEQEKRELAGALREALERQRSPVFDNVQLRSDAVTRPSDPST